MTVSETAQSLLASIARDLEGLLHAVRAGDTKPQLMIHIGGLMVDVTDLTAALSNQTETIRACALSTLIGFQGELGDRNIEFICDQIVRKATMGGGISDQVGEWQDAFIEICDELGCAYDQESFLIAIDNLKQRASGFAEDAARICDCERSVHEDGT